MNHPLSSRNMAGRRRRGLVSVAMAAGAAVLLLLLWKPIVAWFTGKPMGGGSSETVSSQAGNLTVEAALRPDPPRQQGNSLLLTVLGPDRRPVEDAEVEVEVSMPAMGAMSEMRGKAEVSPEGEGRYRADFDLQVAGTWTAEVKVRSPAGSASPRYTLTVGNKGLTPVGSASSAPTAAEGTQAHGDEISHYTCPMHPSVRQEVPGACPICGMDLVPVRQEQAAGGGVEITPEQQQLIGLQTSVVASRPVESEVRAVGRIAFDETRLEDVTVKYGGYIGRLYVEETGQPVRKGQTLFTLYSPELYAAQQEYLVALASQRAAQETTVPDRADYLVRAARQKLRLWDVSESQVRQLANSGKADQQIAVPSPASGYVVEKDVVEGAAVQPGMRLYRIAALDRVWVEAEVYESELPRVRIGQSATVTLPYQSGQEFHGRVSRVLPTLDPETRTGRVRIELANRTGASGPMLRPDMYADVALESQARETLMVPESAVLYTGPRRLVFLDTGNGRFQQREVRLGARSGDFYEVLAGLQEGDQVVTSGNFLVDAEARLRTGGQVGGGAHGDQ
jgi:RND family efflux transporter MFP subunit